ncbi:MAG: ABC transporter ATP-binding protein [Deltaproteobacteria bacterium]|nr:ABC transporter ATP-binding protein [Candidatus Anaeroferrophillus wilburensis]MBN2888509.1 ABC transporter ATP-binding protein [Deltaproteobacteria bacterium]
MLEVKNLTKKFGGVTALNDISFSLEKGEIFGIIGPNGSGKTTLINCITGFVSTTEGDIVFNGRNIKGMKPHRIVNLGICRTFQIMRPYSSLPAYKNLVIPLYGPRARKTGGWRGGGRHGDRNSIALDLLEEVGFERESKIPYKLAGTLPTGYLKRLELARCLALDPDLLICDEVFSGLSMSEIASMVPLITKLNDSGVTIIMIEHRLKELFQVAKRVMAISYGDKIVEGSPEKVMANAQVREAYLGVEEEQSDAGC